MINSLIGLPYRPRTFQSDGYLVPRAIPVNSTNHWIFPCNTLHGKCKTSVRQSNSHLSKCKLRLTNQNTSRQWGLSLFYLYLHTHRTGNILYSYYKPVSYMNCRGNNFVYYNGYSLLRICTALWTNVFLRSYSTKYQQFFI